MTTASTASHTSSYISNLVHAAKALAAAVFSIQPGKFASWLLRALRRTAALDAGEKL